MKIELIPAIDIIDGKCVRLSQGDYGRRKEYNERPLEVAKRLEGAGIRRLHVVDLDGAASSHIVNYRSLEEIASHTSLIVDFGGGLKTDDDLRIAFECGASMITGGSIAVKDPETFCRWLQTYGTERIILGADAKDKKVYFTDKHIEWNDGIPECKMEEDAISILYDNSQLPLERELRYFVAHLEEPPEYSTGEDGYALVRALEESRK